MAKRKKKSENKDQMALSGHLTELRNRVAVCIVCLVAAFLVCLNYAPDLVEFLTDMGKAYGYQYIYVAPQELLMQHFSISLLASVCITFPVLLYQIWAFVRPGLKKKENLVFVLAVTFGLLCFLVGVYFAYRIMLPFMLEFLIGVSAGTEIAASITVANYITFLLTMFMIFGIVFELPVLSVMLTQLGLVKVEWMKKGRRFVIVIIFFVAAVITPPDIVSQIMVAVPMIGLYELSVILCTILSKLKRKKKKEAEEEEEAGEKAEAERAEKKKAAEKPEAEE